MTCTKEEIHVVIVEDDEAQQEMYRDCIQEFNLEDNQQYEIKSTILPNDKEVAGILYRERVDAIIIDLNWGGGRNINEGNQLVEKIYRDCRIPIFIISGNLNFLEKGYEESPIFRKYERDEVFFNDVLQEIKNLYRIGYTKVLGNHSKIDEMLSKVFWKYMSDSIKGWMHQTIPLQEQRMLRFAVTRINEMLAISEAERHDDYDAVEFYIKPPIKEKPFTGDIVLFRENQYLIITAACDMEQEKKADYIVLCQINVDIVNGLRAGIEGDNKKAEQELMRYINNGKNRYHLLPPCRIFDGGLVDFQMVTSIKKEELSKSGILIASVNPAFHKDIQARFSHYYGRQGQPQLNKDSIINWIKNGDEKSE